MGAFPNSNTLPSGRLKSYQARFGKYFMLETGGGRFCWIRRWRVILSIWTVSKLTWQIRTDDIISCAKWKNDEVSDGGSHAAFREQGAFFVTKRTTEKSFLFSNIRRQILQETLRLSGTRGFGGVCNILWVIVTKKRGRAVWIFFNKRSVWGRGENHLKPC